MYSLVSSITLARTTGSQWSSVDLSNMIVHSIFNNYQKCYLRLSHFALEEDVYVDLDVLKYEYGNYNDTLAQLLIDLGDRTLPTVSNVPTLGVKYVKYSDAIKAGYKIDTCLIGQPVPINYPPEDLVDLKITRPNYDTEMSLLHSHCLLSVNGFIHYTANDDNYAYVKDGGATMRKSNQNHLGITSFLSIGELTKVPVVESMVAKQAVDSTYRERIYLDIPDTVDIENKTVFLILGGYIVFIRDNTFWQVGDRRFALNMNNLPYLERLFESMNFMDLKSLNLSQNPTSPNAFDIDEIWSDETLLKYLTLSQTFIVVVDSPRLVFRKLHLRNSNLPGMFTAYQDPVYPLFVGHGRLAEYWKIPEDGYWSVNVTDSYLRNFVVSYQQETDMNIINNNLISSKLFYHSRGFMLEISN